MENFLLWARSVFKTVQMNGDVLIRVCPKEIYEYDFNMSQFLSVRLSPIIHYSQQRTL